MLLYTGKYGQAEAILNDLEALTRDESGADPRAEAVVYRAKAIWAFYRGLPEAHQWLEAAMAGFERSGDLRNASITRQDLGFVFLQFGAYQEAERLLRQSLAESERINLLTSIPQVKQN